MKPDFSTITKHELRVSVVAHLDNQVALHAFVDRFTAEVPLETFDIPNSESEVKQVERLMKQPKTS